MSSAQRKRDAVQAAMSVASDVTEGRLDPGDLDRIVIDECRKLMGQVIGPEDALWPLQCEVARGVLAAGGIPANELGEWWAVARRVEADATTPAGLSTEEAEALAACRRLFANDPAQGPVRRESQVAAAKAIAGSGLLELFDRADFVDTVRGLDLGEGESVD